MTPAILSIVGGIVVTTLILALAGAVRVVLRSIKDIERPESAQVIVQDYDDAWIHAALKDLTMAVSEGVENVARSERRVRAVVASAKRRFEAEGYIDPGLEAEEALLPEVNEGSGPEQRMLDMPNDVEPDNPWLSVPGMRGEG